MRLKKLLFVTLPYVLFVYPFDKLAQAFRLAPGAELSKKILYLGEGFSMAFASFAPSFHPRDLFFGICGAVFLRAAVYMRSRNAKKYRHGREYGSARCGA